MIYFCFILYKLGWILGGRVEQPPDMRSESSLLVSTVGSAPDGIKPTARMLTSIDPSLSTKSSLGHFWNLEAGAGLVGFLRFLETPCY